MYPSTLTTFVNPNPNDRLNNPSHSSIESAQNTALTGLQTFVGTLSSTPGSLIYDIRSPNSDGGGHVQSANKGGTGQTSYTKGDILVASSSSVLTKLSVSSVNGYALVADSGSPTGLNYSPVVSNKVTINSSAVGIDRYQGSVTNVLFSASIAGSILGDNNGIKFTGYVNSFSADSDTFTVKVNYGPNSIATLTMPPATNGSILGSGGRISGHIIGRGSSSVQQGFVEFLTGVGGYGAATNSPALTYSYGYGTASVNSSSEQSLVITGIFNGNDNNNQCSTFGLIVEKIA